MVARSFGNQTNGPLLGILLLDMLRMKVGGAGKLPLKVQGSSPRSSTSTENKEIAFGRAIALCFGDKHLGQLDAAGNLK